MLSLPTALKIQSRNGNRLATAIRQILNSANQKRISEKCRKSKDKGNFMNTQNLQNKVKKIGLASAMLFGFVLLGGIAADAQDRDQRQNGDRQDNSDRNRGGDNMGQNSYDMEGSDMHRSAMQFGHRDGMSQGRMDARRNRDSNWQGAKHYRNARRGYNSRNGSFTAFQGAYRGGFTTGYGIGFGNGGNRRNRRGN